MRDVRLLAAALTLMLWAYPPMFARADDRSGETQTVLFVCEHGSVKSLLAKSLFEQAAAREGLTLDAVSRGITPDPEVPEWMRVALKQDGFNIGEWRPVALSEADLRSAQRVITFDVTLPHAGDPEASRWDGLPAISEDYAAGRAAIGARIDELVRELRHETSTSGGARHEAQRQRY